MDTGRFRILLACTACLACLGIVPGARAATSSVTLAATADVRVVESAPNTNYASTYLRTTGKAGGHVESVLKFAVSGVTLPLISAKLRLYASAATVDGPAVYATSSTWTETAMTWNNRVLATGAASDDKTAIATNTWVEYNVKPLITGNATLSFKLQQPGIDDVDFQSREQVNRPQLVLTWDPACAGKTEGAACSDGNACTTGDTCKSGACSGAALNCNDGNACTTDTCVAATGCANAANTATCNADGNACTVDACSNKACLAGVAKVCTDNDACTADSCNATSGSCVFATIANCQIDTLIAKGTSWKYLANGSNQGTAWRAVAFDDSTWPSGNAELGYGSAGQATTVGYGGNANAKYITTYFRRSFKLVDPSVFKSIALTCKRNDGAVVYLNGTEVFRSNMDPGTLAYTSLATATSTDFTFQEHYIDPALLLTGSNVVAVEVHQAKASSTDLAFDLDLTRRCALPLGNANIEAVETLCDGLDNDCDGLTDVLLPIANNACTTGLSGECMRGYSACMPAGKSCLVPPPVAEVKDGLDNDCNGSTDDGAAGVALPVRARVMLPNGMGTDAVAVRDGAVEMLNALGVPAFVPDLGVTTAGADFNAAFSELGSYSLLIIPGYLIGSTITVTQLQQLDDWVAAGGVLLWIKPSGADQFALAGVAATTQHVDVTRISVTANNPGALYLDSLEERDIRISNNPLASPVEVFTYALDPASGAQAFGTAMGGNTNLGAALVRRPIGRGAVYTLGYDPLAYTDVRCYINCFDPGRDIMKQLVRAMFRESARGHFVLKHATPGTQASTVLLTHDLCAEDAQNADPSWGQPGAVQMATMEQARGVKSSYFLPTDYVNGYYNAGLIGLLCNLGMCPEGGHSVQHVDMTNIPVGDCSVTQASYTSSTPTICGETRVDFLMMLEQLTSQRSILAWRAPYLGVPDQMFPVLNSLGVLYDSSFAIGDTRINYPVSVARFPQMQWKFHGEPMWTFPLTLEDGIGTISNGVTTRTELQRSNQLQFINNWTYAMLQNRANHAWTVQLVHPSYGLGVGPENLPVKIESVAKFVDKVKQYDVLLDQIVPLGEFWRARDAVQLVANYDPVLGYSGTITTGGLPISRFALEFGDNLTAFACSGGTTATVVGNRVVLGSTLAANTTYSFSAK